VESDGLPGCTGREGWGTTQAMALLRATEGRLPATCVAVLPSLARLEPREAPRTGMLGGGPLYLSRMERHHIRHMR
jgi:hypothetical protein